MSFIEPIRTADTSDADIIRVCAEHIANHKAYNATAGVLPLEEDPLWHAYERTLAAVGKVKPRTLAGLAAKARVAKVDATHPDGVEAPGDALGWAWDLVNDLIRLDEERRQPPGPLPPVLDLGRQIVRLSNRHHELNMEQLELKKRSDLTSHEVFQKERECDRLMALAWDRECTLVDVALGLRARTLGDVTVMLGLAWRVLDLGATCEFEESDRKRALAQIRHALLTSLDVVCREAGLALEETVGDEARRFIDQEHADLGDGL